MKLDDDLFCSHSPALSQAQHLDAQDDVKRLLSSGGSDLPASMR